jgi:hypothetical protein
MAAEHEQWVIALFEGMSTRHKAHLVQLLGELKQRVQADGRRLNGERP